MSIGEVTEEVTERLRNYGLMESQSRDDLAARTGRHYHRSRAFAPGASRWPRPKRRRYPEAVLDIIIFVRRLQKERPDLSLEDVAEILPSIPQETVRSVARGEDPFVVKHLRSPPRLARRRTKSCIDVHQIERCFKLVYRGGGSGDEPAARTQTSLGK